MKTKEKSVNNNKIILEIIIIPLCISYLFYMLLGNFNNTLLISIIIISIMNLELLIKYIKEVNIYKSKYNIYKILFIIFNITSLFISFITIYKNINKIYFIISSIISLIYFLVVGIKKLITISKTRDKLYKLTKSALLSLLCFFIIITCLIKLI